MEYPTISIMHVKTKNEHTWGHGARGLQMNIFYKLKAECRAYHIAFITNGTFKFAWHMMLTGWMSRNK